MAQRPQTEKDKYKQDFLVLTILGGAIVLLVGGLLWTIVYLVQTLDSPPDAVPATDETNPRATHSPKEAARLAHKKRIAPQKYTLPKDTESCREKHQLAFHDKTFGLLSISLRQLNRQTHIEIPAGTILSPVENENLSPVMVCTPLSETITPTSIWRKELSVVSTSYTKLETPSHNDEFAINPKAAAPPLAKAYIKLSAERERSWGSQQAGLWMLSGNIDPNTFFSIKVRQTNRRRYGKYRNMVANYEEIMAAKEDLIALEYNIDTLKLVQHEQAAYAAFLKKLNFENPDRNYVSLLNSNESRAYAHEPTLQALLLKYADEHDNRYARQNASRCLTLIGFKGTPNELVERFMNSTSYTEQFIAAYTLVQEHKEPRGFAALTSFSKDPELSDYFDRRAGSQIYRKTRVSREKDETYTRYYDRAMNWKGVPPKLKALILKRREQPNPTFQKAMADLKSPSTRKVRAAVEVLREYRNNTDVFEALKRVIFAHEDTNARIAALYSLPYFDELETYPVFENLLKDLEDERFGGFLVSAITRTRPEDYGTLLIDAAKSEFPDVRKRAIHAMRNAEPPPSEDFLLDIVTNDPEYQVQKAACRLLSQRQSEALIEVLWSFLEREERRYRWMGLHGLREYENNKKVRAILLQYKDDDLVGKVVQRHLTQYSDREE